MTAFSESVVTQAALAWLERRGWRVTHGIDIAPGEAGAERADYSQVVREGRLPDALARLSPALPPEALEDAFRRLTRPEGSVAYGAASLPVANWSGASPDEGRFPVRPSRLTPSGGQRWSS